MAQRAATDLHPKVRAAASWSVILGTLFTLAAALGIVVPEDVQNTATILVGDIAVAIPVIVAYLKTA